MTADVIALSVTWYKIGAHNTSAVTGMSFSHLLLRDCYAEATLRIKGLRCRGVGGKTEGGQSPNVVSKRFLGFWGDAHLECRRVRSTRI